VNVQDPVTPYRDLVVPEPWVPQKRPRPILGATLGVFGATLWAFVVVGQLTTSWSFGKPMSQGFALTSVALVYFTAWATFFRLGERAAPPKTPTFAVARALAVGAAGLFAFAVALLASAIAGEIAGRTHPLVFPALLVGIAVGAVIAARRLVHPTATAGRRRIPRALAWAAAILVTLVTFVDIVFNG